MTKRDELIAALIAQLDAVPGMPHVERELEAGYNRHETPVVIVTRGAEIPDYSTVGVVDRTLGIFVTVIAHGCNPEVDADNVIALIHPAVMAFTADDVLEVAEMGTEAPDYEHMDRRAAPVRMRYTIKYRTPPNTL